MRLAIKFARSFLPLLLLLLLQSGCTYALWTNENLVAYKEPAPNPDLHVFQSKQQNDFLVVYHEHSARCLSAVPVFYSPSETNVAHDIFAICDTNKEAFTLFSGNCEIGCYDFPVYHDHWGNVEKVALTPVAVTADATVVAGIVGLFCAYGRAGAPFDPFGN